jgi:transposase
MRANLTLSASEEKELKEWKKQEKSNKIYRRYIYIELSHKGLTNLEIAEILGVTNDTLTDWKKIYERGGLKGLSILHYEGRRESKLASYTEAMKKQVSAGKVTILEDLQKFLEKEYDLKVEASWLSRWAKKNSVFPTKKPD